VRLPYVNPHDTAQGRSCHRRRNPAWSCYQWRRSMRETDKYKQENLSASIS